VTAPTLTYAHGFLTDCEATTEKSYAWDETEDGNTATLTALYNDIFQIAVTNSVGNKVAYYSWPDEAHGAGESDIDIARATYDYAAFRYMTSDSSIKAKIVIVYDDATQTILDNTSNTTWTYGTAALATGTNIDHVRLYANSATGYVWYDFLLCCKGVFTFPFLDGRMFLKGPKKTVELDILCKDAGNIQHLGMKSPQIQLEGTMDVDGSWGTPDGEYLYYILRDHDQWQWLTSDKINCKVVVDSEGFSLGYDKNVAAQRVFTLPLKLYSQSSLGEATWDNKAWFGQ